MKLKEIMSGLYVCDASNDIKPKATLNKNCHYSLVSTIGNNQNKFTPREVRAAKLAVEFHKKIGRPAYDHFSSIVESNLILDCPVTTSDIKRALSICGKDPATLKGKTKQSNHKHMSNLSDYIIKWHLNVTVDNYYR